MISRILCTAFVLCACISTTILCINFKEQQWYYVISTVFSNVSNNDYIDIDLKTAHISRNVYGISGFIDVKRDIPDDAITIEIQMSRSVSGSNNYVVLPFKYKENILYCWLNNMYRDILMPSFGNCSNALQLGNREFKGPLVKKKFEFNKCLVNVDTLPKYLIPAIYKIEFKSNGLAKIYVQLIVRVYNKVF
ncbi:uncharacterized protein LOC119683919 [Teleopsis dalmanni]|uniref:uncharacterized protein LOC119677572 n=1 Tax=Teleopsis dalmanni TaxID=139649 RepID=UPI0018CCE453|nr:uncharacterized protein LOC119677572 [Teleopsis dalmanni]XP_037953735.1 uncharacterized protein LOC119683919 [Teleopsis dalmanni]